MSVHIHKRAATATALPSAYLLLLSSLLAWPWAMAGSTNLICTSVGPTPNLTQTYKLFLHSLIQSSHRPDFVLLVLTATSNLQAVHDVAARQQLQFQIEYHPIASTLQTDADAGSSQRKLEVFSWPRIQSYTKILYLDVDHIVSTDMSKLFHLQLQPDVLYAMQDQKTTLLAPAQTLNSLHNERSWGFQNYSQAQLDQFKEKKILTFSTGLFLFLNSENMKAHFATVKAACSGQGAQEQSVMNYYFNSRYLSNTQLLEGYNLQYWTYQHSVGSYSTRDKLVYFTGVPASVKIPQMRHYYQSEVLQRLSEQIELLHAWLGTLSAFALESLPAAERATWWMTMGHIGQVPREVRRYYELARKAGVRTICEIGFNAGHSAAVFRAANPTADIYMFDLMALPYSQRAMGLMREMYPNTFHFVKGSSFDVLPWILKNKPDFKCDLFSVDGDHSYEGALTDFINALAMMQTGGVLLADDTSDRFDGCKKAFEAVAAAGYITDVQCETPEPLDANAATAGDKRWCWGTVVKTAGHLAIVHKADVSKALAIDAA